MQEVSPQTNSEGNLNQLTADNFSVDALDFAQPGEGIVLAYREPTPLTNDDVT